MNKFRQTLQRAGLTLRTVDLSLDDVAILRESAVAYLSTGEFLQAFTFDRLLSSQVMIEQVVNLPARGFALREDLIRRALSEADRASALVKFVLRISYVSQGAWEDLFPLLVRMVHQEPGLYAPRRLVDLIEEDVVFLCNLLCSSYPELRQQAPVERRGAIESSLERYRTKA
jgi:hypothetical protein